MHHRLATAALTLAGCAAGASDAGDRGHSAEPHTDAAPADTEPHSEAPADTEEVGADTEPQTRDDTDDTDDTDEPPVTPPGPLPGVTGGYVDVTASLWATGDWSIPPEVQPDGAAWRGGTTATWGDVNGDGAGELVVHGVVHRAAADPTRRVAVFRPTPAGFVHDEALSAALSAESHVPVGNVVDLDGDGDDDLVRLDVQEIAVALVREGARINATVPPDAPLPYGNVVPVVDDVDLDGWLDVLQASRSCSDDGPRVIPLLREGEARWRPRPEIVPDGLDASPYALMRLLSGGEDLLVFLGDPCGMHDRHPGFYRRTDGEHGYPRFEPVDAVPSDASFRRTPLGAGRAVTALQPMGGAVVDLDADGLLDVVITPSWSVLLLFRGTPALPWEDVSLTWTARLERGPSGEPKLPWAVAVDDVDLDGWPELFVGRGDDNRVYTQGAPYNGPYQPSVYHNRRGRGFVEARHVVGLDLVEGETQILVAEDIDDDGDRDLIVAGTELLPRVLRNDVVAPGAALSLRLRGTTSNHLGVGAVVQATSPGLPRQTRLVGGEASFRSAGDHLIVLAAGADPSTVRVTWPTGREQVLELAAGRHEVVEPPLIALSETDRRLPADGASALVVTVTPTTPEGAVDPSPVGIELLVGGGVWTGPAHDAGGTWTRTLVAPSEPGSSVIAVTIGGVPVRVRPRVWWDPVP